MTPKRLKDEIGKRLEFESPEQEAILNIVKTGDHFLNRFGKLFREHGLTSSQYNVLRILHGEGKPMPCLEISQRMIQAVPAMTGLIDRLEAQKLVRRVRCQIDRRIIYIDLTPEAKKLLDAMAAPVCQLHRDLIGHLTPEELTELSHLLEKARHHTDDAPSCDGPDSE